MARTRIVSGRARGGGERKPDMTDELNSLREELEHYRGEREKIRDVIGQIGGTGHKQRDKLINTAFLVLVVVFFLFDVVRHIFRWEIGFLPPIMLLEVAVLLVSLKIIWMMHSHGKVEHFQFWMLNAIEFRLNVISRRVTELNIAPKPGGPPDADGVADELASEKE